MAIRFAGASTQYINNAASLVSAYPFTVGLWLRPVASGVNGTAWTSANTASSQHYWSIRQSTAATWLFVARAGGTAASATAGVDTAGAWHYIVARGISATNRRLSVIDTSTGAIAHAQNTTSRTPTTPTQMSVGAGYVALAFAEHFNGRIAEFWYTNTDIQPDAAQLMGATLQKLAYEGPFSIPHIGSRVLEYRSFWSGIDSRSDKPDEVYHSKTRQVWAQTNGPTLEAHAPAASRWVPPREARRVLVV